MTAIQINHVKKCFGKQNVLNQITFDVEEKEIFGFIGPNGAGKSTLIKILCNFIFPTSGSAQIFGLDVTKESAALKKLVSYVPSEVRYYEQMKPTEIFSYVEAFHHIDAKKEIAYLCEAFQVDQNKKFASLSLGNKKKIALVVALLWHPKLIILDEPTNGLDPLIQKRLFEILHERQKQGTTVFLSSHTLSEVEEYCTRVGFIKNGQIITTKSLLEEQKKTKILTIYGTYDASRLHEIGAKVYESDERKTVFFYEGALQKLSYILAENPPKDYTLENLSLEDEFLSYYSGGEQNDNV